MYAFYARDMKQSLRCLKCMLSQKYTLHCLKHTPRRMLSEKQCNAYFMSLEDFVL